MEFKLKPCRFCGGRGHFIKTNLDPIDYVLLHRYPEIPNDGYLHMMECSNCGALTGCAYDDEGAARWWNEGDIEKEDKCQDLNVQWNF